MPDDAKHGAPVKLRSQLWFDNPDDPDMSALYVERYLNWGLTREELQSGRPLIGIAQTGSDLSPCNRHHMVLAQRVREADRKIGTLALMDVYGRVASTLLELAVYQDGKLVVGEKLSQQDLANMVGASREMVNRILKDLAERGFIEVESKSITILNKELPAAL